MLGFEIVWNLDGVLTSGCQSALQCIIRVLCKRVDTIYTWGILLCIRWTMRDDDAASYPCYYIICHMHTDNLCLAFVYPKTAVDDNPSCSKQNNAIMFKNNICINLLWHSGNGDVSCFSISCAYPVYRYIALHPLACATHLDSEYQVHCRRVGGYRSRTLNAHYIHCFVDICACYRTRDRRAYKRDQVHGIVHNRCVPQCLCDTNEHTTNDWTVYVFGILRVYYVIDSRIKNRIMVLYAHVDDANPSEAQIMVLVCDFR